MHIAVQLLIAIIISEFIAVIPQDVVQSLVRCRVIDWDYSADNKIDRERLQLYFE